MAGGSGERFWPLSRRERPKQFVTFMGETTTYLGHAVANLSPIFSKENIFFVTGKHLASTIRRSFPDIPGGNVIVEPVKRNTTGCLILAAAELLARFGGDGSDITMAVFPSDHRVLRQDVFKKTIQASFHIAENHGAIITFGLYPTRPETGYGYIETSIPDINILFPNFKKVTCFHEKPDYETAQSYVSSGRFYWNSGMFVWTVAAFAKELKEASPVHFTALEKMASLIALDKTRSLLAVFKAIPDISIDYALMEKACHVYMFAANFGWDDIGTWEVLDRICSKEKDSEGNITFGRPVVIDSKNCIIYNDIGQDQCAVGVIGVEGLVVVAAENGVLVIPKERAQDVKKIVEELKKRGSKLV